MTSTVSKASLLVLTLSLAAAASAHAQVFVSPFAAVDFGADTGCLNLVTCAGRYVNAGVGAGRIGRSYGLEEEVAYAKDFFGSGPGLSSSVLTLMTNVIVMRHIGRWNPYGAGGVGVMRTNLHFTEASYYATDRTTAAWDLGGGTTMYFSRRLGLHADARYLRSVRDVRLSGFSVSDSKMGFGRAGAGLIVRF